MSGLQFTPATLHLSHQLQELERTVFWSYQAAVPPVVFAPAHGGYLASRELVTSGHASWLPGGNGKQAGVRRLQPRSLRCVRFGHWSNRSRVTQLRAAG
jgi:hypothetical protein